MVSPNLQMRRSRGVRPWRVMAAAGLWLALGPGHLGAQQKVDFEKEILPVLDSACFKCHSARTKKIKGEIRLDELSAIRAKNRSSNLVFPRKPEKSLLVKVISLPQGDEDIMPPGDEGKPLTAAQISLIRSWIEQGADFGEWKSAAPRVEAPVVDNEPVNAADVARTAARIDALVEAALTRNARKPNALQKDDLWCRRVYLDLIGRIPTFEEINAFLSSRKPAKRALLIDSLLASNGHVSTMTNYWNDVLRARDELAENVEGTFYLHFIKESIRTNKPYDRWVREMVSPEGSVWKSPAVGYYLRDLGNRFANVDNTATIFLGTQIGCAQCHDHPYDQWSRKAYHQFAAWTSAITTERKEQDSRISEGEMDGMRDTLEKKIARRTTSQRRQMENSLSMDVLNEMLEMTGKKRLTEFDLLNGRTTHAQLPADYKYSDGSPNAPIMPAVLFGQVSSLPPLRTEPPRRPADVFANWLTSPENPRFALSIANRMWARLLGAPFAGSVDSIRDPEDCANPELARYLTRVMIATGFDLRAFQRIVANTRTYARQSGSLSAPAAAYDFAGPLMRRMSAEQVWDSLVTLAVPELDAKITFKAPDTSAYTKTPELDPDKVLEKVKDTAHYLANEKLKEMRRHTRPKAAPYAPSPEFQLDALLRASELPQPTPEGHFLRVFGQSNREVSEGGWRSGTVPQTLIMLNSTLFDVVVRREAPLTSAVKSQSGDSARLRAVYLSILGREPTIDEVRLLSGTFGGTGNVEAIAHTLLGTRQFLFIQ